MQVTGWAIRVNVGDRSSRTSAFYYRHRRDSVAPVFVDGKKTVTLKGDRIEEICRSSTTDVRTTHGGMPATPSLQPDSKTIKRRSREKRCDRARHNRRRRLTRRRTRRARSRCRRCVLPDEKLRRGNTEDTSAASSAAVISNLRAPVVEPTPLFVRSIGVTDIERECIRSRIG
jgi:hypothetical protein